MKDKNKTLVVRLTSPGRSKQSNKSKRESRQGIERSERKNFMSFFYVCARKSFHKLTFYLQYIEIRVRHRVWAYWNKTAILITMEALLNSLYQSRLSHCRQVRDQVAMNHRTARREWSWSPRPKLIITLYVVLKLSFYSEVLPFPFSKPAPVTASSRILFCSGPHHATSSHVYSHTMAVGLNSLVITSPFTRALSFVL